MWNYVLLVLAVIGSGECKQCSSQCLNCTPQGCTSCPAGYYLDSGRCEQCTELCLSCSNTTGACTSCRLQYYLKAGTCFPCASYCISCNDSAGICDQCEQGYYGETCLFTCLGICNDNICDKDSGKCINGCKTGFYTSGNWCARCPNNCTACQNGNQCTNCTSGHYLRRTDDGLVVCSPCDDTCSSCEQSQCLPSNATTSSTTQPASSKTTTTKYTTTTTKASSSFETVTLTVGSFDNSINNSAEHQLADTGNSPDVAPIIAGSVVGTCAIVVVLAILIVVLWTKRRKLKRNSGVIDNNVNSVVSFCRASHASEKEGSLYSTPNKVKNTGSNKKKSAVASPQVPVNYENTNLCPRQPPKITAYLDDDLMEETGGQDADPTRGRLEDVSDTYYNTGGLLRRHMTAPALADVVAKRSFSDYEEEFKKFPDGLTRNYENALKKENCRKNRYKKVYPYDTTRVILKDGGDGDYINASYIATTRGNLAYIAALGPTVAHSEGFSLFWRMVWQEKVDIILVLTKLKEGEKMKFERYWPLQGRSETYGPIEVHNITEENYAEFTIRRFSISRNSEQRTIYQAHYTAWPDRSVPDNLVSLLDFRHKVRALPSKQSGPVVVHCSAGIGRTGTYIALDLLIHEGQSSDPFDGIGEPSVDVYGCVSTLRGQRVNMVQNVDQYRYLHHALVHALIVDTGPIPTSELQTCLSDDGKSRLAHQFKMLQRVMVLQDEDTTVVDTRMNARKNRAGADIPGDKHRPSLSYQAKSGDSDYINAIYLDGHVDCRKFLVTQTPLHATVKDFLRLVFQEHVHSIVSMDPQHVHDKDVGLYVPGNNKELKIGSFSVRCTKCETRSNMILRELNIQSKSGKGTHEITLNQFHFTGWLPDASVPVSAESLTQIIRKVERIAGQEQEPGPIIVHCLTGAKRSGLFCTVSLLMEKAINDQAVSVVNTVSHVKSRRSMAIPTVDQYIFCHECIAVSSQSAEYTNVAGSASQNIKLTSQSAEYTNVGGTASHNI